MSLQQAQYNSAVLYHHAVKCPRDPGPPVLEQVQYLGEERWRSTYEHPIPGLRTRPLDTSDIELVGTGSSANYVSDDRKWKKDPCEAADDEAANENK